MVEDVKEVKRSIKDYFEFKFQKENNPRPRLVGMDFPKLHERKRDSLEEMFSREEIKEVVISYERDKSPRPNGFNTMFLKKCWEMVRDEVIKFV